MLILVRDKTCKQTCEVTESDSVTDLSKDVLAIDINRTPFGKTRQLSSYQLTHDKVLPAWTSDIHAAARQEPTGGPPVFILYSTQSSSYYDLHIYSTNKRLLLYAMPH